jgi:HPr kinase/phosphorylase
MSARAAIGDQDAEQSGASEAVHASALVLGEAGVLIRGPSGSGKSGLSLALLALARDRKQFARLIGDDRVSIRSKAGRLLASGVPNVRGLIERRGYGLVEASTELCAIIRLVVDLLPPNVRGARLPEEAAFSTRLGGINLPRLAFDTESASMERAYGVLGYLDTIVDKNMTRIAHFT